MIKTQVITEAIEVLGFPILMQSVNKDTIVLFTAERTGTVVEKGEGSEEVGYYGEMWLDARNPAYWEVFKGELKLSND